MITRAIVADGALCVSHIHPWSSVAPLMIVVRVLQQAEDICLELSLIQPSLTSSGSCNNIHIWYT